MFQELGLGGPLRSMGEEPAGGGVTQEHREESGDGSLRRMGRSQLGRGHSAWGRSQLRSIGEGSPTGVWGTQRQLHQQGQLQSAFYLLDRRPSVHPRIAVDAS